MAHHYLATLLLSECKFSDETQESFRYLYCETENQAVTDIRTPKNEEEMKVLGFCHRKSRTIICKNIGLLFSMFIDVFYLFVVRKSLQSLEDSSRHARLNRELRGKAGLQSALQSMKDRILATFERKEIQSEDELEHYLDPPQIMGKQRSI